MTAAETPTVTAEQRTELREAAEKVHDPARPWVRFRERTVLCGPEGNEGFVATCAIYPPEAGPKTADYIALANPATIIALLDGYEALKADFAKLDDDLADAIDHARGWQGRGEEAEAALRACEAERETLEQGLSTCSADLSDLRDRCITAEAERERMRVALAAWEAWWHRAYDSALQKGGHPDHGIYAYELSAKMFIDEAPRAPYRATITKEPDTDATT